MSCIFAFARVTEAYPAARVEMLRMIKQQIDICIQRCIFGSKTLQNCTETALLQLNTTKLPQKCQIVQKLADSKRHNNGIVTWIENIRNASKNHQTAATARLNGIITA